MEREGGGGRGNEAVKCPMPLQGIWWRVWHKQIAAPYRRGGHNHSSFGRPEWTSSGSFHLLIMPIKKKGGPSVLLRNKGTGADAIVHKGNGQGSGAWLGALMEKRAFSRHQEGC